jgi:glycosyltransferase involved in cell wall biosynthesis
VSAVHVIVPEGVDDPARPSGGNTYDRRVCQGLAARGWAVREHAVPGAWPHAGDAGHDALALAVGRIPDGAVVLLDGLIASAAPGALVPHARRLRQVVLVHMPLEDRRERAVLEAAAGIVTTSAWTRRRLRELYGLADGRIRVAEPGADLARPAPGTAGGGELLCVAAVTPGKGHDVLLDALAAVPGRAWRLTCVGSLERAPGFAAAVRERALGLGGRVRFAGPRTGAALARAYAAADLLVLPSRAETYGLVVGEALARAVPVLASDVGGVGEALGPGGAGLLVAPGDAAALGTALRRWLEDAGLRARLRGAARERRATLRPWAATAGDVAAALAAAAEPVLAGAAR